MLDKAIEKLPAEMGEVAKRAANGPEEKEGIDAHLCFSFQGGQRIERHAVIKKEIRKHQVVRLQQVQKAFGPVLLVAERLFPNIKVALNEAGIDWIDMSGNIRLKEKKTFIWIDRHTSKPSPNKQKRAFTKTGLKVVFLFLHDESWLNRSYREIAAAADVALGNITAVINGLKEHDFIMAKSKTVMQLKNRDKLLDQWITAFADELKPRITKGRYRFLNKEIEQRWKELDTDPDTLWGGEPAADLLTHNLKPSHYILYSRKNRGALMKDFRLVPHDEGNVEVREPYWTVVDCPHPKTAPLLTVYTDLMETGAPRNMNTARLLYEKTVED